MNEHEELICEKCQAALVEKKVHFTYLGHAFSADLPCCPSCGQVFISEELAKGRIAQVEMTLEDK